MRRSRELAAMETGANIPPKSTLSFKVLATGVMMSGAAFLGGVAWNLTDKHIDHELVDDCYEKGLSPEYSEALLDAKEDGTVRVPKSKDAINLVYEDGKKVEMSFDQIQVCKKLHEAEKAWWSNHPSRKLIIGGGAAALVLGVGANGTDSKPTARVRKSGTRSL